MKTKTLPLAIPPASVRCLTLERFLPPPKNRSEKGLRTRAINALAAIDTDHQLQCLVWTGKIGEAGGPTFKTIKIRTVGHLLRFNKGQARWIRNIGTGTWAYLEKQFNASSMSIGQLVPDSDWHD